MFSTAANPSRIDSAEFQTNILGSNIPLFSAKVSIRVETSRYLLKTVESLSELQSILELRGRVFPAEFGFTPAWLGFDADELDFTADHLAVFDIATGEAVGTYRLLCSSFSDTFYSASEFDIRGILALEGKKLELSRACVHPSHRKGAVIALLWKGLAMYSQTVGADFLFGCSSVRTTEVGVAEAVYRSFRSKGRLNAAFGAEPVEEYLMPGFDPDRADADLASDESIASSHVPALLKAYLKAGAMVLGEPALDSEFRCIDFLTLMETASLNSSFERRFQL